jgi:hypothetical protein
MMQNAVLARDNMKKRKFPGNPMCSFFDHNEDRNHLFFTCTSAKVFGSISGSILGANNCPNFVCQCFVWFYPFSPRDKKIAYCPG